MLNHNSSLIDLFSEFRMGSACIDLTKKILKYINSGTEVHELRTEHDMNPLLLFFLKSNRIHTSYGREKSVLII